VGPGAGLVTVAKRKIPDVVFDIHDVSGTGSTVVVRLLVVITSTDISLLFILVTHYLI
jgi:hypothetical protein